MTLEKEIIVIKQLRKEGDELIQKVKELEPCSETNIVITKLQEAVIGLDMDLKRLNQQDPYPSSKNPNTGIIIDLTADGVEL